MAARSATNVLKLMGKTPSIMREYMFLFAQDHVEFRVPELQSLVAIHGIKMELVENYDNKSPFLVVRLPSDESALLIMGRCILTKSVIELWARGNSRQEVYSKLREYPKDRSSLFSGEDQSFCLRVHTFGKTHTGEKKISIIQEVLQHLDFKGRANLSNPDNLFFLYEDYGINPNSAPEEPYNVYFGRWITDGQRKLADKYSVKKRHFIGNTSMDAGLSFIMANQARITPNSFVFDPFVGTGSLLISCAHFGAYVMGADINYETIHGCGKSSRKNQLYRGKDENIRANLRQYGLEHLYIDVLLADFSCNVWREQPMFDAIVTDPPYGIRESTRKIGSKKEKKLEEEHLQGHIPSSRSYCLADIFMDLLNFSAQYLCLNGRLVYWLPTHRPQYTDDHVPRHPCLSIVANSEQPLTSTVGRRLITMIKTRHVHECTDGAEMTEDLYQSHNAIRSKVLITPEEKQKRKLEKKMNQGRSTVSES
ncbi:tRNA (guanine(10)-N2)-methyltransferase homolog [Anneissia japonica]|uniref:tRNA (guanine(10)-N2)-methyltransferase homolog n=1 Tax=Anneissia japonica TaxID=1529436 RepID=UPI001425A05E|nr:tRNA (guanine(10)-N2)-methyltransferase homolog [Anneissia japonica]